MQLYFFENIYIDKKRNVKNKFKSTCKTHSRCGLQNFMPWKDLNSLYDRIKSFCLYQGRLLIIFSESMRKTIYNQSYKSTIVHTIDTINDFYWKLIVKNSKGKFSILLKMDKTSMQKCFISWYLAKRASVLPQYERCMI